MKKAYIFLIHGFEETEMITCADILRRGGINAQLVSLENSKRVISSHRIPIEADILFPEVDSGAEALIFPGGGVVEGYMQTKGLAKFLMDYHDRGKIIAAICAAPVFLYNCGLLNGKNAVCFPSLMSRMPKVNFSEDIVAVDGNVITSKGPATSPFFALKILEAICGKDTADSVAEAFLVPLLQNIRGE